MLETIFSEYERWLVWCLLVFVQQMAYLFSNRAKASASLRYSGVAGTFSHTTYFLMQLFLIDALIDYRALGWSLRLPLLVMYVTLAVSGTLVAQYIALRWLESGMMRVGTWWDRRR